MGGVHPGLINLCVLFLDAQSAPNKGSVDAQNKTYAHCVSHAVAVQQEVHVAPPHIFSRLWQHFYTSRHTKRATTVTVGTIVRRGFKPKADWLVLSPCLSRPSALRHSNASM
jgi:hypothetical protein